MGLPRAIMPTEAPSEDEDEDGHGDPPEAKELMQELGEGGAGRKAQGGRGGGAGFPATGLMAVANTVALGVISTFGHVACAASDWADKALMSSPFGE